MCIVHDRQGEEYQIKLDDNGIAPIFSLKLNRPNVQSHRIGYANCWMAGDTMLLHDIHIDESVILVFRSIGWFSFLRPVKREERHFRNLGLGTVLLNAVVDFAKSKGVKRIEGKIVKLDYDKNPDLPNWYRRRGFDVVTGSDRSAWEAKISLEIQNTNR
jgi:hypothetical protein